MFDQIRVGGQDEDTSVPRLAQPRMQTNTSGLLICPNEQIRQMLSRTLETQHANVANALKMYPNYNHLLGVVDADVDAFIVELDTDTEAALDVVETICSRKPGVTVMVYSSKEEPALLVR